ncbi:uncharacterized protein TNCV_3906951 [Trichonephila clavipes]|nr:uncharacterized protein TNCV_3906951 [Trichonephila clavipes]
MYAQATKSSTISTTIQTDPNITNIICPPLHCLKPVSSENLMLSTSSSVSTVSTSSSSTQAHLFPFPSAIIPTIQIPLPESVPTTSNSEHSNAPEIPQCVKRNSRNRKKHPKVQKPEIEIKMAKHKPRKSGPIEYTTDDEDMIMYDVEAEELEPNPEDKFTMKECFIRIFYKHEYMRALTPTRFRKSRN